MAKATPVTDAKNHHSYKHIDVSQYTNDQLTSMAIKPVHEVVKSLMQYYAGEIYSVNGNDYIPWNVTAQYLNEIFGYMGWSTKRVAQQTISTETELGYEAVLSLTVYATMPDGSLIQRTVENNGYAKVIGSYDKAIDTATKAAFSDALSRCGKLLGPALGLYLYEKETEEVGAPYRSANTGNVTTLRTTTPQPPKPSVSPRLGKDGKPMVGGFTSAQAHKLRTEYAMTDAEMESIPPAKAREVMDIAFGKMEGDVRAYIKKEASAATPW